MTEHTTSYYAASANKYEPFPTLEGSINCDVCVVGGGYTGLSSALHLAEMGYDVVVLEGARIGFGASGRNGGQLVNSYSRDIDVIEKNYGPDAAKMLGSMMFEGGDIIRERIQRYQIQCDYRPGGLFVAMNHKQLETLEEQKANWERYGNTQLELLDREAIRREVDSDRYVGALLDHSGGHIHPLNLAIGEADAIRLNGGRVYEQSPVTRIQHTSPAVVSTARGQVTARYVIVAGNAYLGDKLEPELAKRSMPCGTQVVTTAPLSEEVARSLIPKNYCVEDCNYLLDYYRLTGDRHRGGSGHSLQPRARRAGSSDRVVNRRSHCHRRAARTPGRADPRPRRRRQPRPGASDYGGEYRAGCRCRLPTVSARQLAGLDHPRGLRHHRRPLRYPGCRRADFFANPQ